MAQPSNQVPIVRPLLLALGANMPTGNSNSPATNISRAFEYLHELFGVETGKSRLFRTPCFPPGAGPDYINAAVAFETDQPAGEILRELHALEARFERQRNVRWGMRTMDIDLIALGDQIHPDLEGFNTWRALSPALQSKAVPDQLILPHPRLQDRAFVLVPLAEAAPNWRHPVLGQTITELRDALPEAELAEIRPIDHE